MTEQEKDANLIDIIEIIQNGLKTLKKFWVPILLLIIVLAVGGYLHSVKSYVPYYQSQVTFTVNTQESALVLYGSSGSEQIKESLPYILQSQYMKNLVMEDLGLDTFPATTELESKELANFYVLKVNADSAQLAYDILNSMVRNCPKASVYVLGKISFEILDEAAIPMGPYNQADSKTSLLKGAALGLFVSATILFLYMITNRTIQNEEDLKKYLSTKCLAAVPQISFKKRRKKINKRLLISNDKAGATFLEMIRTMRARVQRTMAQMNAKVVLVTSSVAEEGKSTIAANLAMSLAENGNKVIVVDLDLRNPSLKEVFGLEHENGEGVAEVLKGKCSWKEVIYQIPDWELDVLFGSRHEANAMELLNLSGMKQLMEELRDTYDYVVLDTPPAAMLSDASAIAFYSDCAVYVVKQDYARVERISEGIEALNYAQVPLIGVVLNGMEKVIGRYGSYRSYHYGSYGEYGEVHKNTIDAPEFIDLANPWEDK